MKYLARLAILSLCCAGVLVAVPTTSTDIRRIDFKNFQFPWDEDMGVVFSVPKLWRWIDPLPDGRIRVVRGIHHFYERTQDPEDSRRAPLISVDAVTYGDLDGDGIEEAAVHLNYSPGGTQNWDFLYIYKLNGGRPLLLGVLESGSRAYGGLVRTSITEGFLVLDFADAERRVGDCCSEGYIRVRFRWRDGGFHEEGPQERGDLELKVK